MSQPPWSGRRLHFVGIGGAGMSGIAEILCDYEKAHIDVSGCDQSWSEATEHLRELGIDVHQPTKVRTGELAVWLREKRADVALYRAKREGRNRVVFDAAEPLNGEPGPRGSTSSP